MATEAVPGEAKSAAGTVAESSRLLIRVVANGPPFQFATELGTKPPPLIRRVTPAPSGGAAAGVRGSSMKGTGLLAAFEQVGTRPVSRMKERVPKAGRKPRPGTRRFF